jgi:hypothetical protein
LLACLCHTGSRSLVWVRLACLDMFAEGEGLLAWVRFAEGEGLLAWVRVAEG